MTESKFLKKARLDAGMTQGALCKALGYSNPQFSSNWERDLSSLPPEKMKLFIKVTKCDSDLLLKAKTVSYKKWLRSHL